MSLILKFTRKTLTNVEDAAGRWQFEGGSATHNDQHVANYSSIKRVTFGGADQDSQNAASLTITIFFIGNHPPETITLQGAHDFGSGNATGSVSAASSTQKAHIGKQFSRDGSSNIVKIGSMNLPYKRFFLQEYHNVNDILILNLGSKAGNPFIIAEEGFGETIGQLDDVSVRVFFSNYS
ncbi:hypothetical protein FGG08_000991 [Glutinoglossum americanum]|uniref:Uncharacterized protein n=1 Tax=Glutinoglossum americanum TaxID=1670608 RepID=A0A9P8IEC4_9PEZI|nr:hypothetical protein FGG08_000991 [Glutinoglossum americanum]